MSRPRKQTATPEKKTVGQRVAFVLLYIPRLIRRLLLLILLPDAYRLVTQQTHGLFEDAEMRLADMNEEYRRVLDKMGHVHEMTSDEMIAPIGVQVSLYDTKRSGFSGAWVMVEGSDLGDIYKLDVYCYGPNGEVGLYSSEVLTDEEIRAGEGNVFIVDEIWTPYGVRVTFTQSTGRGSKVRYAAYSR